jgi:hypothetical protein
MKADLGKAGLILLILRWQQQSHNRRCHAISRRRRSTGDQPSTPQPQYSKRYAIAAPGHPSAFKMASALVSSNRAERTGPASIPLSMHATIGPKDQKVKEQRTLTTPLDPLHIKILTPKYIWKVYFAIAFCILSCTEKSMRSRSAKASHVKLPHLLSVSP